MSAAARRRKRYALSRLGAGAPQAQPVTEINIIPVIDISLVLLVILFVTAPLMSVPNIPVELPRAAMPRSSEPSIFVTLARDGELSLRSAAVHWEDLEGGISRELRRFPGSPVVLRVDRAVPYRQVARLLGAAKKAGAQAIAFGTEPPK
jgi:biopolymer transport protein ExbD